jgi:hypothetical protein
MPRNERRQIDYEADRVTALDVRGEVAPHAGLGAPHADFEAADALVGALRIADDILVTADLTAGQHLLDDGGQLCLWELIDRGQLRPAEALGAEIRGAWFASCRLISRALRKNNRPLTLDDRHVEDGF